MEEPKAAPVATDGPSKPTDPPKPTVKGAVSSELNIFFLLTFPSCLEMENRAMGIPWATSPFKIYFLTKSVRNKPINGKAKYQYV